MFVNVGWLLLSSFYKSHTAWFPLTVLLYFSFVHLPKLWQSGIPSAQVALNAHKSINVLSFNSGHFHNHTLYTDAYADKAANADAAYIKEWVAAHRADIKCLQEFYDDPKSVVFNTRYSISRNNPHIAFPEPNDRHNGVIFFGMAIFSKYPIVKQGVVLKKKRDNIAIFADVVIEADTLRIVNAHLTSHSFDLHKFTRIHFKQYFNLASERAMQADSLARFLGGSPYPIIFCGDLNETALTYTYRQLSQSGLTDAFCEAGSGWGTSFRYGKWALPIRIDYQFASADLKPVYYRAHPSFVPQEHNPIEAHYRINAP